MHTKCHSIESKAAVTESCLCSWSRRISLTRSNMLWLHRQQMPVELETAEYVSVSSEQNYNNMYNEAMLLCLYTAEWAWRPLYHMRVILCNLAQQLWHKFYTFRKLVFVDYIHRGALRGARCVSTIWDGVWIKAVASRAFVLLFFVASVAISGNCVTSYGDTQQTFIKINNRYDCQFNF